jgi:uncharacterized protein YnzC (UPF0291/DUF896 family)
MKRFIESYTEFIGNFTNTKINEMAQKSSTLFEKKKMEIFRDKYIDVIKHVSYRDVSTEVKK